jgi:hypothetical protein
MTDDQDHLEAIRHRYWNTSVPYPQDRGHFETCAWMRQADTDLGRLLLLVDAQAGQIQAAEAGGVELRTAFGVPLSEHQIRRLEAMGRRI